MTQQEGIERHERLAGDIFAAADEQERILWDLFEEEKALARWDFGAWVEKARAAVEPIHDEFWKKDVDSLVATRESVLLAIEKEAGKR